MKKITDIQKLAKIANNIRQDIIKMLLVAGSGHSAGPLDMADVFACLFFNIMNINPNKPEWGERDRFVLSCGHICPVLYATMAHAGYFPKSELQTLRKFGTRLHGHPHNLALPGIENSSGPLGQGLSQACGMAYAAKMDSRKWRVWTVLSDGEHEEGQTWEALMFAGKNRLNNLTAFVDRNNIQIDGPTEEVMPLEPLKEKYAAFGWHVLEVDGHNLEQIIDAANMARAIVEKPTVIIAHTIAGKGVDFMEYKYEWHGKPPDKEQGKLALKELRSLGGKITGEHE